MELSLPLVKPIALVRPRGAHRFEAFSAKLQRRVTFCRHSLLELWVRLETDPAVVAFCERPGYIQMEGRLRLADFLVRYVDHDEFAVLTGCDADSSVREAMSSQRSIDGNALAIRRVGPAELAAGRVWIENWQRMLPYVVANHGLLLLSRRLFAQRQYALKVPNLVKRERGPAPGVLLLDKCGLLAIVPAAAVARDGRHR